MTSLWLTAPATLTRPSARKRKIGQRPLIDLVGLQQAIRSGAIDDVWLATLNAEKKLEDLTWEFSDLLDCIACLSSADFKGAEWCEDRNGNWHPCDAYAIRYDHLAKCRVRYSDINYYLKFSLEEDGALTLVLISCHL